jgi:sortase (surface protein transpeptidase)
LTDGHSARRRLLGAVLLAATLAGCARAGADDPGPAPAAPAPATPTTVTATTGPSEPTLPIHSYIRVPPSPPERIEIPGIGVSSPLIRLGLEPDGAMQVPEGAAFDRPGWFTEGPEPGQLGPAVIAGHVDSRSGPSVFYRLRDLRPGDEVLVRRVDGRTLRFEVESSKQYPKAELPTEDVFGPVPWPALRLITCGGAFDRKARSYTDNIVVTTRLVGA